jgi:hypothetical protein
MKSLPEIIQNNEKAEQDYKDQKNECINRVEAVLLREWDDLTDEYTDKALEYDKEEAFLSGQIVEVENLLSEICGIYREYFKDEDDDEAGE